MTDVEVDQGANTDVAARWRPPLETAALILLAALAVSIVGGIVGAVFRPGTEGWLKLNILGFNVISTWHVAALLVTVGLVLALRLPFPPDARGAATARLVLLDAVVLGVVIAICAVIGVIGTLGTGGGLFEVSWPEKIGDILGLLGGGAAAIVAVLLALRAQSLIPAPVRPAPAAAPAVEPAATPAAAPAATPAPGTPGWAADPFARHQWRYWDGTRWTDQVADGSTQSTDPPA
jgi:Kef-type K+ transport system membrane component KefB